MIKFLSFAALWSSLGVYAQSDSTQPTIQFSGYAELYYAYDFGRPLLGSRPSFNYSHNRHNEVNLNLAFLKASMQHQQFRSNIALATGTYMQANYAGEPGVLQHVLEANAGVKLSKRKNWWIDAGIFPSHIGFESAIGKDCWTLSRGILAENSPYYEAGVGLSYTSSDSRWFFRALYLNGWQRIQRASGSSTPSFGHQVTFKPNARWTWNSSSFLGSNDPDSTRRMRYFHNFFVQAEPTDHWGFIIGIDAGWQQVNKGSSTMQHWFTPNLIVRHQWKDKSKLALRVEYYRDRAGVIIPTGTRNGFDTWGYSINYDRVLFPFAVWRVELRQMQSRDQVFLHNQRPTSRNLFCSTVLAFHF